MKGFSAEERRLENDGNDDDDSRCERMFHHMISNRD